MTAPVLNLVRNTEYEELMKKIEEESKICKNIEHIVAASLISSKHIQNEFGIDHRNLSVEELEIFREEIRTRGRWELGNIVFNGHDLTTIAYTVRSSIVIESSSNIVINIPKFLERLKNRYSDLFNLCPPNFTDLLVEILGKKYDKEVVRCITEEAE